MHYIYLQVNGYMKLKVVSCEKFEIPERNNFDNENSVQIVPRLITTIFERYFRESLRIIGYQTTKQRSTVNPTTVQAEKS